MSMKKPRKATLRRSSVTGEIVSKEHAAKHPEETVVETRFVGVHKRLLYLEGTIEELRAEVSKLRYFLEQTDERFDSVQHRADLDSGRRG